MLWDSMGIFPEQGPEAGNNINNEDDGDDCHHVWNANYGPGI